METTFTIVRHGKTLFNDLNLFQGSCDSPLLPDSVEEAKRIGKVLEDVDFVYAACSPLQRAIDTMRYVSLERIPFDQLEGLREADYGILEGEPIPAIRDRDMEQDWIGYAIYGGEDYGPATDRFEQTLRDIACDGEILIVSHGGVICHFLDRILDGWQGNPNTMVPNNSVTRVLYKNERFSVLEMPKTIVDLSI